MKKIFKSIIVLLLIMQFAAFSNESGARLSILINDKGCPTCRVPFIKNIVDTFSKENSNIKIRYIVNSENAELVKNMREYLAVKDSSAFITGDAAKALFDFYTSEDINDTYFFLEDSTGGNIICFPDINSNYKSNYEVFNIVGKASLKPVIAENPVCLKSTIGIIGQVKKLGQGKFSLMENAAGTYFIDLNKDTIRKITFPDSVYKKYLTEKEKPLLQNYRRLQLLSFKSCLYGKNTVAYYDSWISYNLRADTVKGNGDTIDVFDTYSVKNLVSKYDYEKNIFDIDSTREIKIKSDKNNYIYSVNYNNGKYFANFINSGCSLKDFNNPVVMAAVYDEKFNVISKITTNNIKRIIKSDSIPASVSFIGYSDRAKKYYFRNPGLNLYMLRDEKKTEKIKKSGVLSWTFLSQDEKDLLYGIDGIDFGNIQPSDFIVKNDGIIEFLVFKENENFAYYLQKYDFNGNLVRQCKLSPADCAGNNIKLIDNGSDDEIMLIYKDADSKLRFLSVNL